MLPAHGCRFRWPCGHSGSTTIASTDESTPGEAWTRWKPGAFEAAATAPRPAAVAPSAEIDALRAAVREAARRDGFASGHAEGLKAGRAAAEAEACEQAGKLGAAVLRLDQGIARLERDVAQQLLYLAMGIARRVVGETLEMRPEAVLESIREALAQLPAQHATIRLSAADAELVRRQAGEQLGRAGHRIQEDPHLQPGDVIVDSGSTEIDARLETRWQRVWEGLEPEPEPASAAARSSS